MNGSRPGWHHTERTKAKMRKAHEACMDRAEEIGFFNMRVCKFAVEECLKAKKVI